MPYGTQVKFAQTGNQMALQLDLPNLAKNVHLVPPSLIPLSLVTYSSYSFAYSKKRLLMYTDGYLLRSGFLHLSLTSILMSLSSRLPVSSTLALHV